jgi:Holliday junction resolvase
MTLNQPIEPNDKNRYARLCWNTNGWVQPSGPYGKSKNKQTHEGKYGYGHEEWLFDTGKLIDGFHYGFLEPIRLQQTAYENKTYNVWLYTIDLALKKRYWIGQIQNIQVLNKTSAIEAYASYSEKGWLSEMEAQIRFSSAEADNFSNWKGIDLFNIRFLPENIKINDPYVEIPINHPIQNISRYTFGQLSIDFNIQSVEKEFKFLFSSPDANNEYESEIVTSYIREPKSVELSYLHKEISKSLTKLLRSRYGFENVTPEHSAGNGTTKIDIVVNDNGKLIFYEIKTYPSMRTSIRESIGQLIEYAMWTNQMKAEKLIVITQPNLEFEDAKKYFQHIRDTYKIPLYLQTYDVTKNILSPLA